MILLPFFFKSDKIAESCLWLPDKESRTAQAEYMRLQYKGIGRAMKVGKESVMGLVTRTDLEQFAVRTGEIRGCRTSIVTDEAGREICRCKIEFGPKLYGMDANTVVTKLQEGPVAVLPGIIRPISVRLQLIHAH